MAFFRGEIPCENRAITFKNKALPLDHEARTFVKKRPEQKFIHEFGDEYRYKQRVEYQMEKGYNPKTKPLFAID
jgi:hypothetical protein